MNIFKKVVLGVAAGFVGISSLQAGNPDRAGQAGATQLLVNPWARSSSLGNSNMCSVSGVESMSLNPAGLVSTDGSEFLLARSNWLGNLGININAAGYAQKLGADNAVALSIMSFDFGNIQTTTESLPEGGAGSYTISIVNIGAGYSHRFSDNIDAGLLLRFLSEGIPNAKASGAAIDAGIQYHAGYHNRTKFGVALRNVGPAMQYSGDGLSARAVIQGSSNSVTLAKRSEQFELPSVLNIAGGYDIITTDSTHHNLLTATASFTSNAFSRDQFGIGLEFTWRNYVVLRGGYVYQSGLYSSSSNSAAFSGPCAGVTVQAPFGKANSKGHRKLIGIDYAYRAAAPFSGTNTLGIRLVL
jgi:hypothetical protein